MNRFLYWPCALALLLLTITLFSCAPNVDEPAQPATTGESETSAGETTNGSPAESPTSAAGILKQMMAVYRAAQGYSDDAIVRLRYKQQGEEYRDEWKSSVKFARPNKLAIEAFQASIRCDGKEWRAIITDEASNNVDNQVLVRPAPATLTSKDLAADPLLYEIITSQLQRQPIQVELLLESAGLAAALDGGVSCRLLESDKIGGRDCHRIEVPTPGGPFVFWVDQQDYLLRKLVYPVESLLPGLVLDGTVSEVELSAELIGAKFEKPSDSLFTLAMPAGAKPMKSFVIPPRPLPTPLFGRVVEDFYFTSAAEKRIARDDLAEKIVVLGWFHDNPACEATMQELSRAKSKLAENTKVEFLAVATDPATTPTSVLSSRLEQWRVDLPLVRDTEAFGKTVFGILLQPTIVVLDGNHRIQIFQTGGNPQLADQLVEIVGRLGGGEDIAAGIVEQDRAQREQYEKLVAAGGPEAGQVIELPEAVIRPASSPSKMKLTKVFETSEIARPGNLYVIEEEGRPAKLLAIEGWRTVVELDLAGKVLGRHELTIPAEAAATMLRTFRDSAGKWWYLAGSPLGPECYLFDDNWQLVLTWPSAERPAQLCDLLLADLDGKEAPEIVAAHVGLAGLEAVTSTGETKWRCKEFPNVLSVCMTPEDEFGAQRLLVTGESGSVLSVNKYGNFEPSVPVGSWTLVRLLSAKFPAARQATFCGLASDREGRPVAVGINGKLEEQWNYPLPPGAHQRPIEAITSGKLLGSKQGEWLFASPDGSVHLVSEDGEVTDQFATGGVITGIAATIGPDRLLFIAGEKTLTGWKVE
ncbi:hypothetical protein Psta_1958 [Pirellula staleyi DSM 6068]|uniref:Thioredoxin domain-containing protein n=1 Tax=Pirellula staleyi (strain ATCC 27377 / DSM 6068 / ICPB 4128) TaxID=530564 RepID=D2R0N4_PIRSD|nr:hypothetical protein [Pirellula staleyi]ADB16632.1 hypothetical protein Psta_1958 [Pirellula staleyi DSM 6068]